jgi:preprotein translocase subunit SecA
MFEKFVKALFGSQHERDLKALLPILHRVNEKEAWAAGLPAEEFPRQTALFRERYAAGESQDAAHRGGRRALFLFESLV